jgi:hypothetical protein
MQAIGIDLWPVVLAAAVFSALYVLFYRRFVFSLLDPLNIFVLTQVCSCVLAVFFVSEPLMLLQFFAAQISFWLGFRICFRAQAPAQAMTFTARDMQVAEIVTVLLLLAWAGANLYVGATVGFPLLSANPSESKVTSFMGGLGFAKRFNFGIGVWVPASALLLAIHGEHRRMFKFVFFLSVLITALGGSKGGLLSFLYIIGYTTAREGMGRKWIRFSRVLGVSAFAIVMIVLIRENGSLVDGLAGLMKRVLFYGDVVIYYYKPEIMHHFANLGVKDFLLSELNPILGALRLTPYQDPLGYQMVNYSLGNYTLATIMGPNTLFFVRGHVYFGILGGTLYAATIGYIVARVRRWYFESKVHTPIATASLLCFAVLIFYLPLESPLFVSSAFDTFIPVGVCFCVAKISVYALRHVHDEALRVTGSRAFPNAV